MHFVLQTSICIPRTYLVLEIMLAVMRKIEKIASVKTVAGIAGMFMILASTPAVFATITTYQDLPPFVRASTARFDSRGDYMCNPPSDNALYTMQTCASGSASSGNTLVATKAVNKNWGSNLEVRAEVYMNGPAGTGGPPDFMATINNSYFKFRDVYDAIGKYYRSSTTVSDTYFRETIFTYKWNPSTSNWDSFSRVERIYRPTTAGVVQTLDVVDLIRAPGPGSGSTYSTSFSGNGNYGMKTMTDVGSIVFYANGAGKGHSAYSDFYFSPNYAKVTEMQINLCTVLTECTNL